LRVPAGDRAARGVPAEDAENPALIFEEDHAERKISGESDSAQPDQTRADFYQYIVGDRKDSANFRAAAHSSWIKRNELSTLIIRVKWRLNI
jgi:hypothetical protein